MRHALSAILLTLHPWSSVLVSSVSLVKRDPIPPAEFGMNTYNLPGCLVNLYDDPLDWNLSSLDCLVARTKFALPDFCRLYPATQNCVIFIAPAFCDDYYFYYKADTVDQCIAYSYLGPCTANPLGRACTSGLFSDWNRNGLGRPDQGPQVFHPTGGSPDVIFGGANDPPWNFGLALNGSNHNPAWFVAQFLEGMLKNVWNSFIGMGELLVLVAREELKIECEDGIQNAYEKSQEEGDATVAVCEILANWISTAAADVSKAELAIDNKYQKWGDTTALVLGILIPGYDVAQTIGITAKAAKIFTLLKAQSGVYYSTLLNAFVDFGEQINIFRLGLDGEAGLLTEEQAVQVYEDLPKKGFEDLVECPSIPIKLMKRINYANLCVKEGTIDDILGDLPKTAEVFPEIEEAAFVVSNDAARVEAAYARGVTIAQEENLISVPARAAAPRAEEAAVRPGAFTQAPRQPEYQRVTRAADLFSNPRPAKLPRSEDYFTPRLPETGDVPARTPAWPQRRVDPALLDDIPPEGGEAGPSRPRVDPDPLAVLPGNAGKMQFSMPDGITNIAEGSAPEINAFKAEFENARALIADGPKTPGYWTALHESGTLTRRSLIQSYYSSLEWSAKEMDVAAGWINQFITDSKVAKVFSRPASRPLLKTLPTFKGVAVKRIYGLTGKLKETIQTFPKYFEDATNQLVEKVVYKGSDFCTQSSGMGFSLAPGYSGNAIFSNDVLAFYQYDAKLIGPLTTERAVETLWFDLEDLDATFELIGRARLGQTAQLDNIGGTYFMYFFRQIKS